MIIRMKSAIRCVLVSMTVLAGAGVAGMTVAQSDMTPQNRMGEAIELRLLDKVTARTFDFTVDIGDTLEFGSLSIHVRHCESTPPTELPETYGFLQVDDRRLDGTGNRSDEDARIFSGWMFKSRPAASALDHRVFDVWVIGCVLQDGDDDATDPTDYRPNRL